MATRRIDDFAAYTAAIREQLTNDVLRGAGRVMAKVIAQEAKARAIDKDVAASVRIRSRVEGGKIVVRIETRGPGAFKAPWLEHGTSPHFITADAEALQGRSIGKLNAALRKGTLVINGKPVGPSVFHPGARPFPFLRPALDTKFDEALAAGQNYLRRRLARAGIVPDATEGDDA